jgi:hypothetical protein
MGFSLKNAFKNIARKINYQIELSGISLSEPVEKELRAKGWQFGYDLLPAVTVPSMGPCLPILIVKDRNGIGINEAGNGANRDKFYADLREAAARHWLQEKPSAPPPDSRQPN